MYRITFWSTIILSLFTSKKTLKLSFNSILNNERYFIRQKETTPLPEKPEKVQNNDSCNFDRKELKNYISETNPGLCKKDFYLNENM